MLPNIKKSDSIIYRSLTITVFFVSVTLGFTLFNLYLSKGSSVLWAKSVDNRKEIKFLKETYKKDSSGRIIYPSTEDEINKSLQILLEGLKSEDEEVKEISLHFLRIIAEEVKIHPQTLKDIIRPAVFPFSQETKFSGSLYDSRGILWLIDFKTTPTGSEKLEILRASLEMRSKHPDEMTGYGWQEPLDMVARIGISEALEVVKEYLAKYLSETESPDERFVASFELTIKRIEEIQKLKSMEMSDRVRTLHQLLLKYGNPNYIVLDKKGNFEALYSGVQEKFVLDLIRRLMDEDSPLANQVLFEIWSLDEPIRMNWVIEDILLDRKIIKPAMKKASRPIA